MSGNPVQSRSATADSPKARHGIHAWWFAKCQYALPTRLLSRAAHGIAQSRFKPLKRLLIAWFMRRFAIDLGEAERTDVEEYKSFNDFFTRRLKADARPLSGDLNTLISPVDGTVSQRATNAGGRLLQAKGHDYSTAELLASPAAAAEFDGGSFSTIYLAPQNYHGVHMPCDGELSAWSYVPGRLFSVNPIMVDRVPGLFARNERLVARFDTAFGPLALVMVGALFVGSIETMWAGVVSPPHTHLGGPQHYTLKKPLGYKRGAAIGRFKMGSTVILLAPSKALQWNNSVVPGQSLHMGDALATIQIQQQA